MTGIVSSSNNITGAVYDENGNFTKEWDLPLLEGYNFDILENNTVVATLPEQNNSGKSWYLYTTDNLSSLPMSNNGKNGEMAIFFPFLLQKK